MLKTYMSKAAVQQKQTKISMPDAIINLAQRLKYLEEYSSVQIKALELKLGDHENRFIEDAPDMDQLAEMFKLQGEKIEALNDRISELEKRNDIKPPKKKGGTIKLADLDVKEREDVGISFS